MCGEQAKYNMYSNLLPQWLPKLAKNLKEMLYNKLFCLSSVL